MPLDSLHDLTDLDSRQLYAVYLAIARADHAWRVRTLYGDAGPPAGHLVFRPLSIEQFDNRLQTSATMASGRLMLTQRLSRQARAYGVDVVAELSRLRQAA